MNNNDININCQEAFNALVTHIRSNYKTAVNLVVLNKALEVALDYSTNCKKDITHRLFRNLQIAQDLALLQCQTCLLACAILLDIPREIVDTLQFKDVSEILDAYDSFGCLDDLFGVMDQSSDHLYHAVLLHCAKAHRELQDDHDALMHNRAFIQCVLMPAAERMCLRHYVRLLYNDCYTKNLWDEQKYSYTDVTTCIHALKSVSTDAYTAFDTLMIDVLANQSYFSPLLNNKESQDRCGVLRREVSFWEVKEQMSKAGTTDRSFLDLWEVTLSYKGDDESAMMHDYIALHRRYFSNSLTVQYVEKEDHCVTFRLTDKVDNNYLLRLIPQSKLYAYYLGRGCNANEDRLLHGNRADDSCITVYVMRNNQYSKVVIPAGATVLDLAFYVNPTDAVTVQGANIRQMTAENLPIFDDTDHKYPLHMLLKEKDVVSFDTPSSNSRCRESRASVDWFASINTNYAKACLIRYLKEQQHACA